MKRKECDGLTFNDDGDGDIAIISKNVIISDDIVFLNEKQFIALAKFACDVFGMGLFIKGPGSPVE